MPQIVIKSLSTLVVMGDMAHAKYINFWCNCTNVYNGYGPTETTIGATIHKYGINDCPANVGKPFPNYEVLLLNDDLEKVLSNIGEMYIGGPGLAVGYWLNDELTNKKFINTKYGRLYKTGDLGQFDVNNDIIIKGRKDNQIKINGIRIELEEIESLVLSLSYIKKACVIYDKFLIVDHATE